MTIMQNVNVNEWIKLQLKKWKKLENNSESNSTIVNWICIYYP